MKTRKASMIFGILFGVCLFPVAYVTLAIGIALAFAGNQWFGFFAYVFAGLGLISIVGSCFAKKKPLVTLIINSVASILLLGVNGYLAANGILFANIGLCLLYGFVNVLGLLSAVLAGKAYHKQWLKSDGEIK